MEQKIQLMLATLFEKHFGTRPTSITQLPPSGSNRKYYRLTNNSSSAIGVYNADSAENNAFISFSESLINAGIAVPRIYQTDLAYGIYLQQDLGDETLFSFLLKNRESTGIHFSDEIVFLYKNILKDIINIGKLGRDNIDFSKCYPRSAFDAQSINWDLQYFKYYFLKLAHIDFNEQLLEADFQTLTAFLLQADTSYFMYRDFQSRNIMIFDGHPYYIDYQGGRRGARQYDIASLLYDAKADIPHDKRQEMLDFTLSLLSENEKSDFLEYFHSYVLIRILQAMGAYGYRGFFERKIHFLKSIPFALNNLKEILQNYLPPINLPELYRVLNMLIENEDLKNIGNSTRLKVAVSSFSYKHAIPTDNTGNGGGFVFDCRALPNPGRYEQYKKMTGKDPEVIEFFAKHSAEIDLFLSAVKTILTQSITRYIDRGFTNLSVNFGCTGGQHRSVFCAETIAVWIINHFDCDVDIKHWERHE